MIKQATGKAPSLTRAVLTGTLFACLWAILCAALVAKLLDEEVINMETVGYCAMVIHTSAVFIGAMMAKVMAGQMGKVAMGAAGGGYYLCLMLVNLLFFGGRFTGLGITLILVMLAMGAAYLTEGKGRSGSVRRRYKIPS